jgi:hypothetical protein
MPAAVRTRKRPTNAATTSAKAPPKRKRTRQSQRNANPRDKRRLVDAPPSTRSVDTESQESESDAESPPERKVVAREDKEHQLAVDAETARAALSASTEQPPSLVAAPPIDEDFAQEHEAGMARIAAIAAQSRPVAAPELVADSEHKKRNAALNAALHAVFKTKTPRCCSPSPGAPLPRDPSKLTKTCAPLSPR